MALAIKASTQVFLLAPSTPRRRDDPGVGLEIAIVGPLTGLTEGAEIRGLGQGCWTRPVPPQTPHIRVVVSGRTFPWSPATYRPVRWELSHD
jgi:hypothetical protein